MKKRPVKKRTTVADLEERLDCLLVQVDSLTRHVTAAADEWPDLEKRLALMERNLNRFMERVNDMNPSDHWREHLERVDARMGRMEARIKEDWDRHVEATRPRPSVLSWAGSFFRAPWSKPC